MQHATAYRGLAIIVSGAVLTGLACAKERSAFSETPSFVTDDAGSPPACEESVRCSRDLKRVLQHRCDGTEVVVEECGPDFGCGDGACVDACTSAEISKGSIGCSFSIVPPEATYSNNEGSCFATMIANVWARPVTLRATLGAEPLDIGPSTYYVERNGGSINYTVVDGAIAPGKVAVVFLANAADGGKIACPPAVVPAFRADPIAHGTTRTRAFRLTTDAPVSAYSIWPYGGASGRFPTATLLLPISSWDKNYVAVSTWTTQLIDPPFGWPFIQIVAAEDNTEVRMRPNVNVVGGSGVPGIAQGQTGTWILQRDEVLQIKQAHDTSGSPIEASKPVGLFGGAECTFIPSSTQYCDATQQQLPPISQWGSAYALVPYRPRTDPGIGMTTARERVPWRIVGAANGTKLTYDPVRPGDAPETLEAGQVVTFASSELVTVRSQDGEHPFYIAMFMTGGEGVPSQLGDPDFVNVVPSEQFLDRYIFFTDYTYSDTTLTLVRRKTATGFHPVTLECAGEITDFRPLGNAGEYEFAWVYVTKAGLPQNFAGGTCGYGRHEAHSDGPFSIHVWGTDVYASYGYAGGQGSRPLSRVKGPPVN